MTSVTVVVLVIALLLFISLFIVYYVKYSRLQIWDCERRAVAYSNYTLLSQVISRHGPKDIRVAILLTCTAYPNSAKLKQTDPQERIRTYETSISRWTQQQAFPIVVVDNSNHKFAMQHPILEVIAFDENVDPLSVHVRGKTDKGIHEVNSIRYALQHSNTLKRAQYIIKITGRFFVPKLPQALQNIEMYDVVRQNNVNTCQIVGCKYTECDYIFEPNIVHKNEKRPAETHYKWKIDGYPPDKVLRLPKLDIPPTREGGSGKIIHQL